MASDDTVSMDRQVAARCLYNGCDADTVAWALDRLRPHPLSSLQQAPSKIAWRTKPSTYVVCTDDFGVHPDLQPVLAKRCASVVEWPTGHSPFFSDPERVVRLLADLAASTDRRDRGPSSRPGWVSREVRRCFSWARRIDVLGIQ